MKKAVQFFPATAVEGEARMCQIEMPVGGEVVTVAAQGAGLMVIGLVDPMAPVAVHRFWLVQPGFIMEPLVGHTFGASWMIMAPSPQGPQPLAVIQDLPWPRARSLLEVN